MPDVLRVSRAACSTLLLALGLGVLSASSASALTDEEIFRNFRFNLITPGARSLGIGGAFVSIADDATAARANPAGMGFLTGWEVFTELRAIDNSVRVVRLDETIGPVESSVVTASDIDDTFSPTFLSGVLRFRKGLDWTLGISRQELLKVTNTTVSRNIFDLENGVIVTDGVGFIDLSVVNWNVSAGFRLGDRWGVGVTLTESRLDVNSSVTNEIQDTDGFLSDMEVPDPTLDLRTVIDDDDQDLTFSLGLIYRSRSDRWGLGAVYRNGPEFSVEQSFLPGLDLFGVETTYGDTIANTFALPDVIGVGGHWRPKSVLLTVSLNVDRVLYSNLMSDFVPGVNVLTRPDARFEIEDATDYRFGIEFISRKRTLLAFRGGLYTQEGSTITAIDTGTGSFATPETFKGLDDEVHVTVGLGFNFARSKLDLAADFAEFSNQYVISFILQQRPPGQSGARR